MPHQLGGAHSSGPSTRPKHPGSLQGHGAGWCGGAAATPPLARPPLVCTGMPPTPPAGSSQLCATTLRLQLGWVASMHTLACRAPRQPCQLGWPCRAPGASWASGLATWGASQCGCRCGGCHTRAQPGAGGEREL